FLSPSFFSSISSPLLSILLLSLHDALPIYLSVCAMFHFARRYSGNRFCFLFLQILRCFSSLGMPHLLYVFKQMYYSIKNSGFPQSDILGSVYLQLPKAYRC